jgi:hypothetical protein
LSLGGRWVVNVTHRPLDPQERDPVPVTREARWATRPVWTGTENLAPTGIRSTDRPAGTESVYRLSCRGSLTWNDTLSTTNTDSYQNLRL